MKYSLAACLIMISLGANAALNKWVDAEGKVHYSDTAPSDAKVKTLRSSNVTEATTTASGVAPQKTTAEREAEWKKSQKLKDDAAQKAAQEQEAASIKQKNCENARTYLANMENSPVVANYNAKGERVIMDDASRMQKTEEARKAVSSNCN